MEVDYLYKEVFPNKEGQNGKECRTDMIEIKRKHMKDGTIGTISVNV